MHSLTWICFLSVVVAAAANALDPSTMKTIMKSNSKAVGAKLTELFLNHFLPKNSFVLEITNSMVKRRMIDPKIYLKNGKTSTPPSFILPAAEDPYSGTKHIVLLENDPAGTLCYGNKPNTAQPNLQKAVSCVIFNAKTEQYALHAQNGVITNKGLQTLYEKFVKNSDPTVQPTKNQNGGFLLKDYQQFRMIAQQTTGGEVRQLYFEVMDGISRSESIELRKKAIIAGAFAGSAIVGGLRTLGTFAFNRITADVGTTLTLENESTENAPIVLEVPRWEQNGVEIQDIVPWRLAPKESCKLSFVGSGTVFKRSAIALSFKIQGSNDRVVLSIWWPKKMNFISKDLNAYSVSWLRIPPSQDRPQQTLAVSLRDFVNKATQDPKKFPTPVVQVNNFQRYYIWKFPIVNPVSSKVDKFLNVLTNMGDARTNGMTVKVYATIPDPSANPSPTFIPRPRVYSGLPNEIPLV